MNENKQIIFSNLIWRFAERVGAQAVSVIVSIVLARLLDPKEYGTISLIMVFTSILMIFVDSGLGTALIQKKDADNIDFSTVFFVNILFCIVLYTVLFLCAPLIAKFYGDNSMISMIRVLGLILIVSGVKNVQSAYVARHMMFKKFFFATLGGTLGAGIVGIGMALADFGVWALIAQTLFNNMVDTIILWRVVKWRPEKKFSIVRLKQLWSYGWKLLASKLLASLDYNVRSLIIGKVYTADALAYYNKGESWPSLVSTNINTSIDSVLLPTMSKVQDNIESLKQMTRRAIKTSVYCMAPLMVGLAFVGPTFIRFLLTEKWLPCVPYLRIFCITFVFYPIHTANLNAIKAMGRSDLFLKLEIIKKVVGLVAIISTMYFGVMAMAYSLIFTSITSQIINSWPNKKLLNYPYLEQLKDILPSILLAVLMGVSVSLVAQIGLPDLLTLVIQVPLGAMIYILLSTVFKLESFEYLWGIVKPMMGRIFRKKA